MSYPPANNPLPYPDRHRPPQQPQYGAPGSAPSAGTGAANAPARPPARYSDYEDQASAGGQYPPGTGPSQQPAAQKPAKLSKKNKPASQAAEGPWPTPPTAFNAGDNSFPGGRADNAPPDSSSNDPFRMDNVASALPPQSSTYEFDFDRPHRNTGAAPPIPGKVPLSGPSPSGYAQQQSQPYSGSPVDPYSGSQSTYSPQQTSDAYQGPPPQGSPPGPPGPQRYGPQSPVSPVTAGGGYPQQGYNAQSPVSPYDKPQQGPYPPYGSPGTAPSGQPAAQSGYIGSPTTSQAYPPQGSAPPGPPQGPPQGNQFVGGVNPASPPATGPGQISPPVTHQSPPLGTQQPPPQNEYMSGPPPIPGLAATAATAAAFATPPPTFRPQASPTAISPTMPFESGPTAQIYGKDYPIPAFIQTVQTPSQCDPALKEHYFGPYLRFKNVDLQQNLWFGTILLISPLALPLPQLEFHPSGDFSQLRPAPVHQIYTFAEYQFLRYELVLPIGPGEAKWTYAVTTQQTQTWEFSVAGKDQAWRFIAWSCGDFGAAVKKEERDKLGFETMWKNVMERYGQEGGFHAQLGGGGQIYADRMWKEIPFLIEWLGVKGKDQRQRWTWTDEHANIMRHAYFYYYTSSWSKPSLRDAMAKIPNVFQLGDHDLFDGYGSYPNHLQQSNVFVGLGKTAIEFYLIFQHHTTQEWLRQNPDPLDLISVNDSGWSYVKYFGSTTAVVGVDTRSQRDKLRIVSQQSYDVIFNNLRMMPPTITHCVVMLSIPIIYPRLETVEKALTGVAVAKKGVNGAFNLLGKAVHSVAPAGGKQGTQSAFDNVKKALGKSGLMSNVVDKFGEMEMLDDLMDHWTHASHDRERTYVIRSLQDLAVQKRVRVTFVSGDVHCCGVGYFYDPSAPQDPKLMFQIITSAMVDVPPSGVVIRMLHSNEKYWVPPLNSTQSTRMQSDTKEEMIELFQKDVDGKLLTSSKKLLPRRNYAICKGGDGGTEVWELCVEKGRGSETVKYGPIVIPRCA